MTFPPLVLALFAFLFVLCPLITFVAIAFALWVFAKAQRETAQTIAFYTQTRGMLVKVDYDTREVLADKIYQQRMAAPPKRGPQIPQDEDLRAAVLAGREPEVLLEDPDAKANEDLGVPPPPANGDASMYVEEHEPIPAGGMYHSAGG